jgi:hypothetical protein
MGWLGKVSCSLPSEILYGFAKRIVNHSHPMNE